jgi:hypothetical protein
MMTYFLFSVFPLMKILSPQANMMFLIETQQNLMQKLFLVAPSAVPSPHSSDTHDSSSGGGANHKVLGEID